MWCSHFCGPNHLLEIPNIDLDPGFGSFGSQSNQYFFVFPLFVLSNSPWTVDRFTLTYNQKFKSRFMTI